VMSAIALLLLGGSIVAYALVAGIPTFTCVDSHWLLLLVITIVIFSLSLGGFLWVWYQDWKLGRRRGSNDHADVL
jgi:hypothetical protein